MQDLQSKEINEKEYNSCFFSSFLFLTNTFVAYQYKYFTYSLFFFLLFVTSIIVHSTTNVYTIMIDKVSILLVVLYGAYVFYNKMFTITTLIQYVLSFVIIVCFLLTICLYYYGYMNNCFCFCEDEEFGNAYQSLVHFLSCIGHNFIIVL